MRTNTVVLLETAALFVATVNSTSVSQWLLPVLASAGIGSEASYSSLNQVHSETPVQNSETFRGEDVLDGEERQQSDKLRTRKKRLGSSPRTKLHRANSQLLLSLKLLTAVLVLWRVANVFLLCMSGEGHSEHEAATAAPNSKSLYAGRHEDDASPRICRGFGLVSPEDKEALGEVSSERRKGGIPVQLVDALKSLTKWESTTPGIIIALAAVALASTMATANAAAIHHPVEAKAPAPKEVNDSGKPHVMLTFTGWVWCPHLKPNVCYVDFTHTNLFYFFFRDPPVEHKKHLWRKNDYFSVTLYLSQKDVKTLTDIGIEDLNALLSRWAGEVPGDRGLYQWKFNVMQEQQRQGQVAKLTPS
ncbi:hypothetical protein CSUI_007698 [Cystoisospora suis]|uniref:Transmembrane protein n=1 Tax=Cystoisospora suis TaxID=483139 RepID=A0A2C6KPD6_9APIC|nr:hypothetical protein CSUI_007698 [Cystoisospora suis]